MADENKGPKTGDKVTVINSGDHDLFDPNTGVFYPARTEVDVTFNRFHQDQIAMGNMKVAGEKGAPKPLEGNEKVDAAKETDLAAPVDTKSEDSAYEQDRTLIRDGDVTEDKLPVGRDNPKGRSRRGV